MFCPKVKCPHYEKATIYERACYYEPTNCWRGIVDCLISVINVRIGSITRYLILLWVIAFGLLVNYARSDQMLLYIMNSDGATEYKLYLQAIEGTFSPVKGVLLLNSVLSTTVLPATIQKILHTDPLLTFRFFSCFILPFLSVLVFHIAKRYTSNLSAFLVSLFFITNYVFVRGTSYARTGIACLFFALLIWAILDDDLSKWKRYTLLILSPVGIVLSHYSVAYIGALVLVVCLGLDYLYLKVQKASVRRLWYIVLPMAILLVSSVIWYWGVAVTPQRYIKTIIAELAKAPTGIPGGMHTIDAENKPKEIDPPNFFSLDTREPVIRVAFGQTFPAMPLAKKIEFVAYWLAIITMSLGLFISVWRWKRGDYFYLSLAVIGYLGILLTIILPYASIGYGVGRMFFQMLIFLGTFLAIGSNCIGGRLKVKGEIVLLVIVGVCSLCTTGVVSWIL